ncbi:MAG: hypothetical protein EZS28_010062 [Streblomastix strix]|uniref:Uncharacterized protein n=1 Tax=Streblomastix strix TaxID=222440 RepID=A0A5J4WH59_9EUKA|nr:MAG: hypothetical protein EZS28_010062 [Streblomastix strix]
MEKHRVTVRKVHKEESIYHHDDLLKILDKKAQIVEQLSEDTLRRCTIVAIVAFSELRLEEVMRATVEKDFDNSWSISTSIIKKLISNVILTFRQTSTTSTSPVFLARQLDQEKQQKTKTQQCYGIWLRQIELHLLNKHQKQNIEQ